MHRSVLCALKSEGRSCGLRDKRIWNLGGGGPGSWFHSQLMSNPRPPSIAEVKPHKKPKFQLTASDPGGHGWGGWVAGWVGYSRLAPSGGCFSLLFWFLGTGGWLHFIWAPLYSYRPVLPVCRDVRGWALSPVSLDLYPLFSGLFTHRYLEYLVCAFTFKMYVRCFVRFQRHVTSIHVSINPSFNKCFWNTYHVPCSTVTEPPPAVCHGASVLVPSTSAVLGAELLSFVPYKLDASHCSLLCYGPGLKAGPSRYRCGLCLPVQRPGLNPMGPPLLSLLGQHPCPCGEHQRVGRAAGWWAWCVRAAGTWI